MASSPAATPEERVSAFIADYARAHGQVAPLFDEPRQDGTVNPFEAWGRRLTQVHAAHCLKPSTFTRASFGSDPEFSPDTVTITRIERYGTYARVSMRRDGNAIGGSRLEADLWLVDGDWRMNPIESYYEEPSSPLMEPAVRAELIAKATAADDFCERGVDASPDPDAFFRDGWAREPLVDRLGYLWEGPAWEEIAADYEDDPELGPQARVKAMDNVPIRRTEIIDLGIFVQGGHLAVGDPGWPEDADVCALALPPGPVRAQALLAHDEMRGDRVAALRVLLDPEGSDEARPVRWEGAHGVPHMGNAIGVETGSAFIADAEGFFSLTRREWRRTSLALSESWTLMSDAAGTPIGAESLAGFGDGGYGVSWGLDEEGRPLQLLIDFGVVREPVAGPRSPRADGDDDSSSS